MEKNKTKPILIVTIIVLVLIIAGLVCYIILDKNNYNDTKETVKEQTIENSKTSEVTENSTETEERELTKLELQEIENYINNGKINFLASEYAKPEEANLYFQIIYGYDEDLIKTDATKEEVIDGGIINEEVQEDYGQEFYMSKVTTENMNKYLEDNLGVSAKDVDLPFTSYSEKYDAYFYCEPSDAFVMNIHLLSGKIESDGLYVIKYIGDYDYEWTVTLKKDEENYIFVSNINSVSEKIDEIKSMKNLTSKKVKYNSNYDCVMYYKDNTLYYAELLGTYAQTVEDYEISVESTCYFDNNKCIARVENERCMPEYYDYSYMEEKIYNLFLEAIED